MHTTSTRTKVTREIAATYVAGVLEQQDAAKTVAITNEETETLEQRAVATATRKEETIDGMTKSS